MIDIWILRTKINKITLFFYNDKLIEMNVSDNYQRNYYINNKEVWEYKYRKTVKPPIKYNLSNQKHLIKFN